MSIGLPNRSTKMPWHADPVFRGAAMVIVATLVLEAAFARWLSPGSALGGLALWAVLLACSAGVAAAVAAKRGWGVFWACVIFVLLVILLFCGGFLLECAVGPTGCEV